MKLIFTIILLNTFSVFAIESELYIPSNTKEDQKLAMVVMLHGCTQNANDFIEYTHMKDEAKKRGFAILAPNKKIKIAPPNNPLKCWAWYLPSNNKRDFKRGEIKEIIDLIRKTSEEHNIDPDRIYVAGFSAGAVMSSILANCYPDLFKGAAIIAGVPYKGFRSFGGGYLDLQESIKENNIGPCNQNSQQSSAPIETERLYDFDNILLNLEKKRRKRIRKLVERSNKCSQDIGERKLSNVLIFQGKDDNFVWKKHGINTFMQMASKTEKLSGKGILSIADLENQNKPTTRTSYRNQNMNIQLFEIDHMKHAWPGSKDGYWFSDSQAPNATSIILDQFQL